MAYVNPNCKSKAEIKRRLGQGEKITVFEPGLGSVPRDGKVYLEGPHYPEAHRWYATGTMKDGLLVAIK